jgi:hypothetical protein
LVTVQTDSTGGFSRRLRTTNAEAGEYTVTAETRSLSNRSSTTSFTLEPAAPVRPQEGEEAMLELDMATANTTQFLYLPTVTR